MLDAYIIERLRKEREQRESTLVPLHIEVPREREDDDRSRAEETDQPPRGVVIIEDCI